MFEPASITPALASSLRRFTPYRARCRYRFWPAKCAEDHGPRLRAAGIDLAWINENAKGARDETVLAMAQAEERVLLTFDKGFGELAYRQGLDSHAGIILVRVTADSPQHLADLITAALTSRSDWLGKFSVIEERQVRITELPGVD